MEQQSSSAAAAQRGGSRPELQGPRPAPLKVSKDSHKIRKQQQQQVRQPVIIYTMSPKVVHANAAEFMSVVQRLTGAPRAVTTPPSTLPLFAQLPPPQSTSPFAFHLQDAFLPQQQHSPAAVEQARSSGAGDHVLPPLPSILSPGPGSIPAIPPSFFSPPAGALGELAAAAAPFVGAPSPSPTAGAYYWDLFNNINMQQQQYHHPY